MLSPQSSRWPGKRDVSSCSDRGRVIDRENELDELVDQLEAAGMVTQSIDIDGKPSLRLTDRGAAIGRALAMSDDAAEGALDALLDTRWPHLTHYLAHHLGCQVPTPAAC